jgi:glycosyltransferase involved in cell wall biosynthesis
VRTKLRILHALEAFAGGTERHLLDLVRHVPGAEHVIAVPSIHLGRPTAQAARRAREEGAIVEIVEMTRSPSPHRNAAAINSMRALIRRHRPDVVHGHSSLGGAISRLSTPRMQAPVVYTPNGLSRAPWALTVERYLGSRTDWFVAVSESEGEFAVRKRLVPAERMSVVRNGIEQLPPPPPRPSLRARLEIPEHTPLVGCLGRLTWQKAPEVYVAACAIAGRSVPEAHFVLIGSGLEDAKVRDALEDSQLGDRFHWLDALPDAAGAFGELDLYVLPSRFEGGPYTPLEAMRAHTPVILTDVAGNRDTIEDGVSGLLVPVDDPERLGDAIADLLRDRERRARRAVAGAARLTPLFDVREMGEHTARVYERVLSDRRSRPGASPIPIPIGARRRRYAAGVGS